MFEHQYTYPAPYNGHPKIQFYIPKEQYTGLTAFTEIKCSSFVLHCTIRAGTLDLKQRPIDMAKKTYRRWNSIGRSVKSKRVTQRMSNVDQGRHIKKCRNIT